MTLRLRLRLSPDYILKYNNNECSKYRGAPSPLQRIPQQCPSEGRRHKFNPLVCCIGVTLPTLLPAPQCSPRSSQLGTVLLFNILRPRNKVFLFLCPPRYRLRRRHSVPRVVVTTGHKPAYTHHPSHRYDKYANSDSIGRLRTKIKVPRRKQETSFGTHSFLSLRRMPRHTPWHPTTRSTCPDPTID